MWPCLTVVRRSWALVSWVARSVAVMRSRCFMVEMFLVKVVFLWDNGKGVGWEMGVSPTLLDLAVSAGGGCAGGWYAFAFLGRRVRVMGEKERRGCCPAWI